jgi:hypothetical protein
MGRKPHVKADEPANRLEPLGKRRKECGAADVRVELICFCAPRVLSAARVSNRAWDDLLKFYSTLTNPVAANVSSRDSTSCLTQLAPTDVGGYAISENALKHQASVSRHCFPFRNPRAAGNMKANAFCTTADQEHQLRLADYRPGWNPGDYQRQFGQFAGVINTHKTHADPVGTVPGHGRQRRRRLGRAQRRQESPALP